MDRERGYLFYTGSSETRAIALFWRLRTRGLRTREGVDKQKIFSSFPLLLSLRPRLGSAFFFTLCTSTPLFSSTCTLGETERAASVECDAVGATTGARGGRIGEGPLRGKEKEITLVSSVCLFCSDYEPILT
jgi:hypothetical protein